MGKESLIIDGDILAFRCAAASETRSVLVTHKVTGQQTEHAHRTAFKEHIRGLFEIDEFSIEDVQKAEDISFSYHAINTCIEAWQKTCDVDHYEVYISGVNNFRDFLPLPTRYKNDRVNTVRPILLKECRDYLVHRHKAVVINGQEVDDKLAQRAYEGFKQGDYNVILTLDKDSYGVESYLYDWTKMKKPLLIRGLGEIYLDDKKVLRGQGRKWFYSQWVKGDSVDCFKPSEICGKKFGDTACFKLLDNCKTDKECIEAVYEQYKTWYPGIVEYKAWDGSAQITDAIGLMDLYAACAHMKRFDSDVFDTKKLLTKLGVSFE